MTDAARTRQAVWIESEAAFAASYPHLQVVSSLHPAALAVLPLVASGRVIGSYALGFDEPRTFPGEDRELLTALGQLCAQALDRARVYEAERRARAALETTNAKLEAIIQASPAAIMLLDPDGRVDLWNPAAERTFGWTAAEILSRPFPGIPDDERREAAADLARVGRGEALLVAGRETRRSSKRGETFDVSLWMAPVHLPDGSWRCLSVMVDITERKRAERALRDREADLLAAYQMAQEADRRKDEFLAMLGHELRNPLAPISTALHLWRLRGEPQSERERGVIERQVRQLERLVDDLLDISRITRGKVTLARQRVDLAEAVALAIEMAGPLLEEKRQRLEVRVARGQITLDADQARLAQVIGNLLTNAAKFTDPGGEIAIAAEQAGGEVVLSVRDRGEGIAPELLPHVFDPFSQAPQSLARPQGGLGLGLAIAKRLVELHGGTVQAHSEGPGRGSEFVVRLPAAAPAPLAEEAAVAEALAPAADSVPRRILVVDDNREAAESLAELLSALGHTVEVAFDGQRALELAVAFQPDVALLDIGLPVMDGYELARHLRRHAPPGSIRLIAITGYGQEHDRDRAAAAGFDRHLVKPVDVSTLLRLIDLPLPAAPN